MRWNNKDNRETALKVARWWLPWTKLQITTLRNQNRTHYRQTYVPTKNWSTVSYFTKYFIISFDHIECLYPVIIGKNSFLNYVIFSHFFTLPKETQWFKAVIFKVWKSHVYAVAVFVIREFTILYVAHLDDPWRLGHQCHTGDNHVVAHSSTTALLKVG